MRPAKICAEEYWWRETLWASGSELTDDRRALPTRTVRYTHTVSRSAIPHECSRAYCSKPNRWLQHAEARYFGSGLACSRGRACPTLLCTESASGDNRCSISSSCHQGELSVVYYLLPGVAPLLPESSPKVKIVLQLPVNHRSRHNSLRKGTADWRPSVYKLRKSDTYTLSSKAFLHSRQQLYLKRTASCYPFRSLPSIRN